MFAKRRATTTTGTQGHRPTSTAQPAQVKVVQVHKVGNQVRSVSNLPVSSPKTLEQQQPQRTSEPKLASTTASGANVKSSRALVDAGLATGQSTTHSRDKAKPGTSTLTRPVIGTTGHATKNATSLSDNLDSRSKARNGNHRDSSSSERGAMKQLGVDMDGRHAKKRKVASDDKPLSRKPAPVPSRTTSSEKRSVSGKKSARIDNSGDGRQKGRRSIKALASPPAKSSPVNNDDDNDSQGGYQSESSEDGTPGFAQPRREPSPVVERNVLATEDGNVPHVSGAQLVAGNRRAYKEYFIDPTDLKKPASEWSGDDLPTVTLAYPGQDSGERFILLAPKNADEYNPITDVVTTIRLVIDNFLTSGQAQSLLNHTQGPSSFSAFLSAPGSRSGTPGTPNELASPAATPLPPLMRSLEKARAKKDGPSFLAQVERYNEAIRHLKSDDNKLVDNIRDMKGLRRQVWEKIASQAYERAVGPEIEELRNYPAFSDNVYGELLPKFMAEIFQKTGLGADSVFVDLGSGVGNCVVQAALATGCEAWGFENMKHASALARKQVIEAESRFRMWGIKAGSMNVVEADFCEHPQAGEVLKRADVILVNNEVFTSSLNERLSLLFLDLRSGTKIVSLKAFASSFTLSAHNRHSPLAIIRQGPALTYPRNSVSWKSESGTYYIGHIDRSMLEKFDEQEQQRAGRL
ncbi:Nucleosomal histone H3-Lys79 methylase [Microbotryomycetes sp. JL201]|nr:Nucleosomal histone H3-Lys79 methylase [Microbotryomycetes sp. JL201]